MNITSSTPHGFSAGEVIECSITRPAWWRVLALWRWWRNPYRHGTWVVTNVEATTFEIQRAPDPT